MFLFNKKEPKELPTASLDDSHVSNANTEVFADSVPQLKTVPLKNEENDEFLNLSESNLSSVGVIVGKPVIVDMQSFEEWKEMKLKEIPEASTASTAAHLEAEEAQAREAASSPTQLKNNNEQNQQQTSNSAKKPLKKEKKQSEQVPRHKNYAGLDCGAKIVENNPDSSNPSHVLTENKDDYMLNSCKNNVWFVIELCEPIKLIEFSLANLELFSNVPRQFRIYASERYLQSTNWNTKHLVGTFEALNTRTIQTFSFSEPVAPPVIVPPLPATTEASEQAETASGSNVEATHIEMAPNLISTSFIKFVKFEMISHYGTEHFCPLSLVRIYGKSKSDDDGVEDATEFEQSPEIEQKLEINDGEELSGKEASSEGEFILFFYNNFSLNCHHSENNIHYERVAHNYSKYKEKLF